MNHKIRFLRFHNHNSYSDINASRAVFPTMFVDTPSKVSLIAPPTKGKIFVKFIIRVVPAFVISLNRLKGGCLSRVGGPAEQEFRFASFLWL